MKGHTTGAGAMVLLLVTALSHHSGAMAHGTTDLEQDPCLRRAGDTQVHFSAYQPQYEITAQYCTEIPQAGDTFLVVDLVDASLRREPVGMQVVKDNGKDEGELVVEMAPRFHTDGVLRSNVRLEEGLYRVTIASETQNLLRRPQYLLQV